MHFFSRRYHSKASTIKIIQILLGWQRSVACSDDASFDEQRIKLMSILALFKIIWNGAERVNPQPSFELCPLT